jgi:hypothetical protein
VPLASRPAGCTRPSQWNPHTTWDHAQVYQAVVSLFEDGYKPEGDEPSSNLQLSKPSMQPTENARVVASDKENLVTLQVQTAIEHGYEMLPRGYQNVE